jgi:FMN phosphatase YigB (HAD superfamily)
MTLTLLLDLDDTLLNTNQATFVPAYFKTLTDSFAPRWDANIIARALLTGTAVMNQSRDPGRTLEEVFHDSFLPQVGMTSEEFDEHIEEFYSRKFPTLQPITSQNPQAKPFVDWAQSQGYRIAIATDPLLPREAAYQRVRWAGFEPEQFDLISTFDNFHFSKTYPAYYAEALGRLGWQEGPVLMAGNDMERDILPAKRLGLAAFFVEAESGSRSGPEAGLRGSLPDLRLYLESADFASLVPSFAAKDAILAIQESTPAVMDGLTRGLDADAWKRKPSAGEWTMTELICHLRDTETEVHHMQLKVFENGAEPFIPRPDTGVWASQRDYMHEDGLSALKQFSEARRATLDLLMNASDAQWEKKARHAIFGPTNFREVAGFIADHDRLHAHQAWSLMKNL